MASLLWDASYGMPPMGCHLPSAIASAWANSTTPTAGLACIPNAASPTTQTRNLQPKQGIPVANMASPSQTVTAGASETAAQVAGGLRLPLISPSSLSPSLSDGQVYPYFLRVSPSSATGELVTVDIILNVFGYTSVTLVHSSDAYGTGAATSFSAAAGTRLAIKATISFEASKLLATRPYRTGKFSRLRSSNSRIIVLIAQALPAAQFVRLGLVESDFGGAGYLWVVGEASLADEAIWDADPALKQKALKGAFAVAPNTGAGTVTHAAYMARRQQLPPMSLADGSCSSEMDDDGVTYLWQQDHDANTSTPMMCAGDSPLVEASYDAFGYDAVYAVAHGTPRPLATAILASRTLVRC